MEINRKKLSILAVAFGLLFWHTAAAANAGEVNFNVDSGFDAAGRAQVEGKLVKTSPKIYFYIEKGWWEGQTQTKQNEILSALDLLSGEFDNKIYPVLTSVYGKEWSPGVDGDTRITLLFHAMQEGAGGYFRNADEYIKLQVPDSNEREMMYISLSHFDNTSDLKVLLAHEFTHLISFNQKERAYNVQDDTWLEEARAEYSASILGYNDPDKYDGSNLQKRVKAFLEKPNDSLTEWQERKYDYGVVNVFTQYLMDHYGITILTDSLKSKYTGIESINYALSKNNYKVKFDDVFTDWTIALAVNNCSLGPKYCFLNENLKNLKVSPALNFLPVAGDSSLSVTNVTKNWAGNWQKIIGGSGDLKLEFSGLKGLDFDMPYILEEKGGTQKIGFLFLDEGQKGEISILNFRDGYSSLIIIPSLQSKVSGFEGAEYTYPYTVELTVEGEASGEQQAMIKKLLEQIEYLKQEIAKLQKAKSGGCAIAGNLSVGMSGGQVTCLQEFLKAQGSEIYPEGLVTGYFGSLTKSATVRFQTKYGIPGTGYVGPLTRTKITSLGG